jgi:hypothetical protein
MAAGGVAGATFRAAADVVAGATFRAAVDVVAGAAFAGEEAFGFRGARAAGVISRVAGFRDFFAGPVEPILAVFATFEGVAGVRMLAVFDTAVPAAVFADSFFAAV